MQRQDDVAIVAPTLPKGGGAIQSIGNAWRSVGTTGAAAFEVPLPISPGRSYAPPLSLSYASTSGNSAFGIGWALSPARIVRRTALGVPRYDAQDEIMDPSGQVLVPERDPAGVIRRTVDRYGAQILAMAYEVTRYLPRVEGAFDRIEHWCPATEPGFWLIHGADGSLHLFGKRANARLADPDAPDTRIAEWLLEESMLPTGEHLLYEYRGEDAEGLYATQRTYDHGAQRYLSRVRYGNATAATSLYLWDDTALPNDWHFELVFDYGERTADLTQMPSYATDAPWPVRADPHSQFAYGFEVRTWRLCRQVLMFHRFDVLGDSPVLVRALTLEHESDAVCSRLRAAHQRAFDASGVASQQPPVEFDYSPFALSQAQYTRFESMPGLNDGTPYQLVDLYGEGLPGVLYRERQTWRYREPVRAVDAHDANAVAYGPWVTLPAAPASDPAAPRWQLLIDLTGHGQLEWVVAQPGLTGFFTVNEDRSWSRFAPFAAFPQEFFHPQGQLADLVGSGLSDLVMIGPRSVRLYANHRDRGFAPAIQIAHGDEPLPLPSNSPAELVAFSDILGSGQQHLVRIRHREVRCWPTLGHGRFGPARSLELPVALDDVSAFDAARIRLADLDGSGATDLIYLTATHARIFMNHGGNGFAAPYELPWPEGLTYDRLAQVSVADLQGLGCSSLVLTVPHMAPRHWRCDFAPGIKPYLLRATNNNMGAAGAVGYRSSAQEWLDEKQARLQSGQPATSHLPFAIHVVSAQSQLDEITGSRLTQQLHYREGYFDGREREFRGFGLVLQTDMEDTPEAPSGPSVRASSVDVTSVPLLTKTWYHTGRDLDRLSDGYDVSDPAAPSPGPTLIFDAPLGTDHHQPVHDADAALRREAARALAGSVVRTEIYGRDRDRRQALPYAVSVTRYAVRQLQAPLGDTPARSAGYGVMLPLSLETWTYQYERQPDDPQCTHAIQLAWDAFGQPVHQAMIQYARRRLCTDPPPFEDPFEQSWWRDAHDDAQQQYYVTEARTQSIHLTDPDAWRLYLPYRQRSDALMFAATALSPDRLSYEQLLDPDGPLGSAQARILVALSMQRYQGAADGNATFEALPAYTETAELDATALQAYAEVLPDEVALTEALTQAGYQRMSWWPADAGSDGVLWSRCHDFPTFAPIDGFRRLIAFQPTRSHGLTHTVYDAAAWLPLSITDPAGCTTQARYDYRWGLPIHLTDPNGNIQEARYDAWGRVIATSVYGHELGHPVGFDPLATYERTIDTPQAAVSAPETALQHAAIASFYAAHSWMGAAGEVPALIRYRTELTARSYLLPDGSLRASARERLARGEDAQVPAVATLREVVAALTREPPHAAVLQADRYPDDAEQQIRIALTSSDGFGRVLQNRQKVEPGEAYAVDAHGALKVQDGQLRTEPHALRWRVSERVEYNPKGLPVRVYRPYFANSHRYIRDEALREHGYHDRLVYDALGRSTETWTANGHLRRQRYLAWYTISEDENDTAAEREETVMASAPYTSPNR